MRLIVRNQYAWQIKLGVGMFSANSCGFHAKSNCIPEAKPAARPDCSFQSHVRNCEANEEVPCALTESAVRNRTRSGGECHSLYAKDCWRQVSESNLWSNRDDGCPILNHHRIERSGPLRSDVERTRSVGSMVLHGQEEEASASSIVPSGHGPAGCVVPDQLHWAPLAPFVASSAMNQVADGAPGLPLTVACKVTSPLAGIVADIGETATVTLLGLDPLAPPPQLARKHYRDECTDI